MSKTQKEYTYREYLEQTIAILHEALKNDSFDYTTNFGLTVLSLAKKYITKAEEMVEGIKTNQE